MFLLWELDVETLAKSHPQIDQKLTQNHQKSDTKKQPKSMLQTNVQNLSKNAPRGCPGDPKISQNASKFKHAKLKWLVQITVAELGGPG